MRRLPARPPLPTRTLKRLHEETSAIESAAEPKLEAAARYGKARRSKWFSPVVSALRAMAGPGERCMWCSGSEASEVEHFRPKSTFPKLALTWKNLLWACGICNRSKDDRFPSDGHLLDPTKEDAWDFFFIDEFGNLTARWRSDRDDYDPRALATIDTLGLDREPLQRTRQYRLRDLRKRVEDSLALFQKGQVTRDDLRTRVNEWSEQPFQPDVADYFLRGPGSSDTPFDQLFAVIASESSHAQETSTR